MPRLMLWTSKLVLLIAATPFCLILSFMPPFKGPREWWEFVVHELS